MSHFRPSINPNEPPKNWLSVNKIEPERHSKEEGGEKQQLEDPLLIPILLKGHLLAFAQQVLSLASSNYRKSMTLVIKETDLASYLQKLQECLISLEETDLSQDPEFLKQFSTTWHDCYHAACMVEKVIRKKSPAAEDVKKFLNSIHTYKKGAENPLGSYLNEEVGKEWFPRPLMDLLAHLHKEAFADKSQSTLHRWILDIHKIASQLKPS